MPGLLDPVQLGAIQAKNRVFMAPLTRGRSTDDHVPKPMMAEYYAQRSGAGLIISEAVGISREGLGWPWAPGIWSEEQVAAWKPVTEAVHAKGGKIVAQLWHMGRAVHSSITDLQPVSSSETIYPLKVRGKDGTRQDPEVACALTKSDIARILEDYGRAARNALKAGFDGVQIHGANGYLIDQFLRDNSNLRTDEYGGSVENRVRFLDDVVGAVVRAIGPEHTGIRLSPNGEIQGVVDSDPESVFVAAAEILNKHKVAWLELRESSKTATFGGKTDQAQLHGPIRRVFKGTLVLNQDYDQETAEEMVRSGAADAIAFGRTFITNPDLVQKFAESRPVVHPNAKVIIKQWYSHGPEGYTDLSSLSTDTSNL